MIFVAPYVPIPQLVHTRETLPVAAGAGSAGVPGSVGSGCGAGSAAESPGVLSNNASGFPMRVRLRVMYLKVGETRTRTKSPLSSTTPVMILNSFFSPFQLVYWIMEVSDVVVCTGSGSLGNSVGTDTPLSIRVLEWFSEIRLKVGATRTEK